MSILCSPPPPIEAANAENASLTATWSRTSAVRVKMVRAGNSASSSFLVLARSSPLRPIMPIWVAPAAAKECVSARPTPAAPPVMKTVFPFVESSGRVGSMAG